MNRASLKNGTITVTSGIAVEVTVRPDRATTGGASRAGSRTQDSEGPVVKPVPEQQPSGSRIVCMYTGSGIYGGAERALVTLASELDRTRWRPVVLAQPVPGLRRLHDTLDDLGIPWLPVEAMPEGLAGAQRTPGLTRLLRRLQPDVFHAHLSWPIDAKFALAAARFARVPAIVATAHLFVDLPMGRSRRAQQWMVSRGVGGYIAVSHHVAERVRAVMPWPSERIEVIPNGIDVTAFRHDRAEDLRREVAGDDPRPLVLTVGRLDEQKGHACLLEAARLVPDAQFALAGDGPLDDLLRDRAARLGVADRIRFLGRREDIAALLACADLFVLPSRYEGLPLAVLEAMAAAVPVVATDVGGTSEAVVDGATGLLVPADDPRALAAAVRRALDDPAGAHRLGAAGRDRARREFTAAVMARRTETIYRRLLAR
jgi:glycosyltransferase involved in cell wall biosynthesis